MKKTIMLASILFLSGCVSLFSPSKPISISDIQGTWEGIQLGYSLLEIEEDGNGYMVFTFGRDAYDVYKITDISFKDGPFIISLKRDTKDAELSQIQGKLISDNILVLSEIGNGSEEPDDTLFFMRETIIQELRMKSKEKLKEIKRKNT